MLVRKLFVLIAGLLVIWWVLASPSERRDLLGGVKANLTPPSFLNRISDAGNWRGRSGLSDDGRNDRTEPASYMNESSEQAAPVDPNCRVVRQAVKVFDESYQPIGSVALRELVTLVSSEPSEDIAVIRTEAGVEGRVPLHALEKVR